MRKLPLFLLAAVLALSLSGCSGWDDMLESGYGYGSGFFNTYKMEQTVRTAYFDYSVNCAETLSTVFDYFPNNPDHRFLILNITVQNTCFETASITMYDTDFELTWEALEGSSVYPEMQFSPGQLPEEYELFKNESITGDLVFIVPSNVQEFDLTYYEWTDRYNSTSYTVHVTTGFGGFIEA